MSTPYPQTLTLCAFSALRHEVGRRQRAAERHQRTTTKTCPICREAKPLTDWGINAGRPDGLQSACRACKNAARRVR